MLGAVIALRRAEHMRLGFLVSRAPPRLRAFIETLATTVALVFVLAIIWPAFDYAQSQQSITTPALEIPDAYRVAAIAIGAALMLLIAGSRLIEHARWRPTCSRSPSWAVAATVARRAGVARDGQLQSGDLLRRPGGRPGRARGADRIRVRLATLAYLACTTQIPLTIVISRMDSGMSGLILLAVPLFVFLGLMMEMAGLARALVDFISALLGHVRGGLAYVLLGAMYLVSGISGSKAADMAAVAPVLFPEMKRRSARPANWWAAGGVGRHVGDDPAQPGADHIGSVANVSIQGCSPAGSCPPCGCPGAGGDLLFRSRGDDLRGVVRAPVRQWA